MFIELPVILVVGALFSLMIMVFYLIGRQHGSEYIHQFVNNYAMDMERIGEARRVLDWCSRRITDIQEDIERFDADLGRVSKSPSMDSVEATKIMEGITNTIFRSPPKEKTYYDLEYGQQDFTDGNRGAGRWIGWPGTICRICLSTFDENGNCPKDTGPEDHISTYIGGRLDRKPCPVCYKVIIDELSDMCDNCKPKQERKE